MSNWTINQVSEWLELNNFGFLIKRFKEEGIDGSILLDLTENDLKKEFEMNLAMRKNFSKLLVGEKSQEEKKSKKILEDSNLLLEKDVEEWLGTIGLNQVLVKRLSGFDRKTIFGLSEEEMKELEMNLGGRKKLMKAMRGLDPEILHELRELEISDKS